MPEAAPPVKIRFFDPSAAGREEWAALHAYRKMRAAEEFPDIPLLEDAQFEAEVRRQFPFSVNHRFLAWQAGEIVGNIILGVRRPDTLGYEDHAPLVDVFGGVLKRQRRRGTGRALFAHLHDFMHANAKTLASIKVLLSDGHGFMSVIGAQAKLRSVESHLAMSDVPWSSMPAWREAAAIEPQLRWEVHAPRASLGGERKGAQGEQDQAAAVRGHGRERTFSPYTAAWTMRHAGTSTQQADPDLVPTHTSLAAPSVGRWGPHQ